MNVLKPSDTPASPPIATPVSTTRIPRHNVALLAAAPIALAVGRDVETQRYRLAREDLPIG